ncbi:MAG: addiction module protein [Gallionella sp.]|nr:addiction module protein [Gallionella sp.]
MNFTVEQITEAVLAFPGEARAVPADRLAESLDPLEDGYIRQFWVAEARTRRDEVRNGAVGIISVQEALGCVRGLVV